MTVQISASNVKKYLSDESVIKTVLVTGASITSGFFAYLLQIYLGRKLPIEDYGTFNAFLSLFSLFTFFNIGITISVIKIVTELQGKGKRAVLTQLFWKLVSLFTAIGVLAVIVLNVFKHSLADFFNIENAGYFAFFSSYMFSRYLVVTPASYIQGLLKFKVFSVYTVLSGFLRAAITGLLAYLGYRVGVLFLGMSIANLIMFIFALLFINDGFGTNGRVDLKPYYKRILNFSVPVFMIYFAMLFFYNVDILMVKSLFDAESAGFYVGAATMGKMILFGTGAITTVMFPQIAALKAKNEDYSSKFRVFLYIQLLTLLVAVLVFSLFPQFITFTLFGKRYTGSISILPLYSIFISLYVLINFFVRFFMAIDKTKVSYALVFVAVLQLIGLNLFPQNIEQVLFVNITLMAALLLSLLIYGKNYFKPA